MQENPIKHSRSLWAIALSELNNDTLTSAVEPLLSDYDLTHLRSPQSGLYLMQLRDSVQAERFNLGEVAVTICHVRLIHRENGQSFEGAACLLEDNTEIGEILAASDAILANSLPGHELLEDLVLNGMELRQQRDRQRQGLLERTAVNFSLLSTMDPET